MNSELPEWQRLLSAARRAPDARELSAPYGFSTRVVALAMAEPAHTSLFHRYALRALGVAGLLLTVGVIATNLGPIMHTLQDETDMLSDPAPEVTELS